jgi:uncharacterized membrane protein
VDTGSQIEARSVIHLERRLHTGPLPHPAILREMGEIYPEAPKLIFEDFHAQSSHRREIEKKVIDNRINLSYRGQLIGGTIGGIGIVGSLIVIGLGHDWAGVTFAGGCLVSLVYVFVTGRDREKQERDEKEKIRQRIKKGEPIEEIEQPPGGGRLPAQTPPS